MSEEQAYLPEDEQKEEDGNNQSYNQEQETIEKAKPKQIPLNKPSNWQTLSLFSKGGGRGKEKTQITKS